MNRTRVFVLTALLVLLLCASTSLAQTWNYTTTSHGYPQSFAVDETGQRILAAYRPGGYWLTNDGGATWTPIDELLEPDYFFYYPQWVTAVDPAADTLFVTGTARYLDHFGWMSQDGGHTWTSLDIDDWQSNQWYMSMQRQPGGRIYCAQAPGFFYSDDNGSTWTEVNIMPYVGTNANGIYVDPDDVNTVFIWGSWHDDTPVFGGLSVSHQGGENGSWTRLTELENLVPPGISSVRVYDFQILDNGNWMLLVNTYGSALDAPQFLVSEDDGQTWSWVYSQGLPDTYWTQLCAVPEVPGRLFLGNSHFFSRSAWSSVKGVWQSDDYGLTWFPADGPFADKPIACGDIQRNPASGDLFLSAAGEGIFHSTDHGDTWQLIPGPPVGIDCEERDQLIADEAGVMHAGRDGSLWFAQGTSTSFTEIDRPHPEGTFQLLTPISLPGQSIAYLAREVAPGQVTGDNRIVLSEDGGTTWTESALYTPPEFEDFVYVHAFPINGTIMLVGEDDWDNNHVAVSYDLGESWETVYFYDSHYFWYISYQQDYFYFVDWGHDDLFRSREIGGPWEAMNVPADDYYGSFARYPLVIGDTLLVHDRNHSYSSSPAQSWQDHGQMIDQFFTEFVDWEYVTTSSDSFVVALNADYYSNMVVSFDTGRTWQEQHLEFDWPFQTSLFAAICWDPWRQRLWVDTGSGLAYLDFATRSVHDPWVLQPAEFDLLTAYPNPFNASTTVRFALDSPQQVKLDVFDVLGRHVATLADGLRPAGEHQLMFDAAGYPSGTYYLRCQHGSVTEERKLVLIK